MSTTTASSNAKKTVYLIRHAESEENRRLGSLRSIFGALGRLSLPDSQDVVASVSLLNVPAQVDSDVSPLGETQIAQLADQLKAANFTNYIQLVAHSPLKRARQTCDGMLQCSAQGEKEVRKHGAVQRVVELDLLTEKTPAEWISSGPLYTRIASMEKWLGQQEEETVALVGHSQYFKAMLEMDFKFGNCDVWEVQYDATSSADQSCEATTEDKEASEYKTPRGWSGLKRLYAFQPEAAAVSTDAPPVAEKK